MSTENLKNASNFEECGMFFATHEKSARMFIIQNVSMSSKTETRATRKMGTTNW